jgi:hypothetical protein
MALIELIVRGFVLTPQEIMKGNSSGIIETSWSALIGWLLAALT